MASIVPESRDRNPAIYHFADRALIAAVIGVGIASAILVMVLLESPLFAAGFAKLFA